jgi:F-type H+-transporting ATPase subunit a
MAAKALVYNPIVKGIAPTYYIFGVFLVALLVTTFYRAVSRDNKYWKYVMAFGEIVRKVRREPAILISAPIMFFVGILELVGEFAKIASLSFRLFGNVFAGEVLLMAMGAILAYVLPLPFLGLEIFVGLIQAFIFSLLTLVYFTIAATDHEEHDEKHIEHAHA